MQPQHHGHFDSASAPSIEPRRRKQGQLVLQGEWPDGELEARRIHIHIGPQAAVQRVFARQRVVPHQAQAEPVVVHKQARVEFDAPLDALARVVRPQGNHRQQLVIEADLKVGQVGQKGRRGGDGQIQVRAHHHLVQPHAKVNALLAVCPLQRQLVACELPQRQIHGANGVRVLRW
ncbi:MAG: hypothetical protein KIT86_19365 [Hydrogenophaga sp.]|nr:hypothetical protein [Hydrogenophaga sp.]